MTELVFLAGMLVAFLLIIFVVAIFTRKPKHVYTSAVKQQSEKPKKKTRSDEVLDSLEWMMSMGIIDTKEYNQLVVKSLPFLK